jgi:hypothetical protein
MTFDVSRWALSLSAPSDPYVYLSPYAGMRRRSRARPGQSQWSGLDSSEGQLDKALSHDATARQCQLMNAMVRSIPSVAIVMTFRASDRGIRRLD